LDLSGFASRRADSHNPTSRIRTGSAGIPAGELQFWPKTAENSNTPAGMPALPVGGVANPRTPDKTAYGMGFLRRKNCCEAAVAGTDIPNQPLLRK